MKFSSFAASALVLVCLGATQAAVAAPSITNLNALTGGSTWAYGISNAGAIVGSVSRSSVEEAYVLEGGTVTLFNTLLGSALGTQVPYAWANDINASGMVVGAYRTKDLVDGAFVYSNGLMTVLGPVGGGSALNWQNAVAVNDSGLVVGVSPFFSRGQALTWSNGQSQELPSPGAYASFAYDVNNKGQIAGYVSGTPDALFPRHAAVWSGGVVNEIGNLIGRGSDSVALDINEAGQVTGYGTGDRGETVGFLYANGQVKLLGSLGGDYTYGYAINNAGVVVGTSAFAGTPQGHAILYTEDGGLVDLNSLLPADSGWVLYTARDINDDGSIVGEGSFNGVPSGYRLAGAAPSVPEPSVGVLLGLGLGLAAWVARRRGAVVPVSG